MKMKAVLTGALAAFLVNAELTAETIRLPEPDKTGGMPLAMALDRRHTDRKISLRPLPVPLLSNLLWSANGFNRNGKRTVPTAMNRQELELYYLCTDGCYSYDALNHSLNAVPNARHLGVPTIVIVANLNKQPKIQYCFVDAGFIGQSIYLFAAANNLATVFKGSFPDQKLRELLNLQPAQKICFIQEIGFSGKK